MRAVAPQWRRYEHPYAAVAFAYLRMGGTAHDAAEAAKASDTMGRRMRYLKGQGEDQRNTVAWRDAQYEHQQMQQHRRTHSHGSRNRKVDDAQDPPLILDELGFDQFGNYHPTGARRH